MSAIESCRSAALGGHVERCEDCSHSRIAYNSIGFMQRRWHQSHALAGHPHSFCRNRYCPKCRGAAAKDWLAAREADLLPVGYFHLVFTLPAEIAPIAYQNKAGSTTCCSALRPRRCSPAIMHLTEQDSWPILYIKEIAHVA